MKNIENSPIFQILQFCSIFGVSGQLEAAWRRLWVVQRRLEGVLVGLRGVLEASWSRGVLEASWGVSGTSWTCLGENVEKRLRGVCFLEGF